MRPWNLGVVGITETARSRLRKKAREIKKGTAIFEGLETKRVYRAECTFRGRKV